MGSWGTPRSSACGRPRAGCGSSRTVGGRRQAGRVCEAADCERTVVRARALLAALPAAAAPRRGAARPGAGRLRRRGLRPGRRHPRLVPRALPAVAAGRATSAPTSRWRATSGTPAASTGCERGRHSAELCRVHYRRQRLYGTPTGGGPVRRGPGDGSISHGYWNVPVRPEQQHLVPDGRTKELEHRLVMAQVLGRPLRADEVVHHRNGDRLDNDPDNLELWTTAQPKGQRVSDQVEWARRLLAAARPRDRTGARLRPRSRDRGAVRREPGVLEGHRAPGHADVAPMGFEPTLPP